MAAIIAAGGAATLLLGLLPGPAALLVAVSVIAGAVRGVFTLTEATLVADYWGADRYAVLNGVFNAPLIAAGAIAPAAGAGIAVAAGSYPVLFAILAADRRRRRRAGRHRARADGPGQGGGNVRKRPRGGGRAARRGG